MQCLRNIAAIGLLAFMAGCAFKTPPEDYKSANPAMADPAKSFAASPESPALAPAVYGNWQGYLPCSDCEGVTYYLTFQKDQTFRESSEYKGKNTPPVIENGTWAVNQDSVVQLIKPSGRRYLVLGQKNLVLLDPQGQRVASEQASRYVLTRPAKANNGNGTTIPNLDEMRQGGVDFFASGSSWNLEIDTESTIRFRNLNNKLQLVSEAPTVQQMPGGKGSVYRAITNAGTLAVRVLNQPCTDKASGKSLAYTVEVTANAQEFTGCGQYLNKNPLQGKWELQELNGKALKAADFPKNLPFLEIGADGKRVSGNGGCNRITGDLNIKGDQVSFGTLASTRMACAGPAMQFENSYMVLLSGKTYTYQAENDRLLLNENGKPTLIYKKAD